MSPSSPQKSFKSIFLQIKLIEVAGHIKATSPQDSRSNHEAKPQ